METPKLTFIYAYPLDENRRKRYKENNFGYYPSIEEVKKTMKHWEELWNNANENDRIVLSLVDITKNTPERNPECFVFWYWVPYHFHTIPYAN